MFRSFNNTIIIFSLDLWTLYCNILSSILFVMLFRSLIDFLFHHSLFLLIFFLCFVFASMFFCVLLLFSFVNVVWLFVDEFAIRFFFVNMCIIDSLVFSILICVLAIFVDLFMTFDVFLLFVTLIFSNEIEIEFKKELNVIFSLLINKFSFVNINFVVFIECNDDLFLIDCLILSFFFFVSNISRRMFDVFRCKFRIFISLLFRCLNNFLNDDLSRNEHIFVCSCIRKCCDRNFDICNIVVFLSLHYIFSSF